MPTPVGCSNVPDDAPIGLRRGAGDRAVAEDGDGHFILADNGLVRDPFVRRLGIERPQAAAVGLDKPRPLRRLAGGLPAEDDLAGLPRIGLHVPDLEADVARSS